MKEPLTFTDGTYVAIVAILVAALLVGFSLLEATGSPGAPVLR
ncbi:MAG: hypothetical protein ACREM3_22210 [Candidatus Rokuibacteriota bacterium]